MVLQVWSTPLIFFFFFGGGGEGVLLLYNCIQFGILFQYVTSVNVIDNDVDL